MQGSEPFYGMIFSSTDIWVIPTTVIKGIEGYVVGTLAGDKESRTIQKTIIAWAAGSVVLVLGYFLVQVYMYEYPAAVVELPFNAVQAGVAGIIGIPISTALKDRLDI